MEIGLSAVVEDCVGVPEPLQDLDVQGNVLNGHVSRQSGVHPSLSEVIKSRWSRPASDF